MTVKPRHVLQTVVQQAAVRALRREFTAGEGGEKLEAYIQASSWLRASHVTFNHLKRIPAGRSGLRPLHSYSSFMQWLPACRIIHQFCPMRSVGKPKHAHHRCNAGVPFVLPDIRSSHVVSGRAFSLCHQQERCR